MKICLKHPNSPRKRYRCVECSRENSRTWAHNNKKRHLENSRRHHRDKAAKVAERKKKYYIEHPDKAAKYLETSRKSSYKKYRGSNDMTPPHMGICPICEKEKLLVYDHCHETGAFRGWICNKCNRGLGYFGDNSITMSKALGYLIEFECGPDETIKQVDSVPPLRASSESSSVYQD